MKRSPRSTLVPPSGQAMGQILGQILGQPVGEAVGQALAPAVVSARVKARVKALGIALASAVILLGAMSLPAATSDGEWRDVEGRIQYGFYTEDTRALNDVIAQLSGPGDAEDPLTHYYVGLANYRLALVLTARDKTEARHASARCVARLDEALRLKSSFAEGMALQAACLRSLSTLTPWKPLSGAKSNGRMERAVKLAPKDPRVLLLDALEHGEDGEIDGGAIAKLRKAANAFEAERQGVNRTPGWGAAEVYAYLGRGYLAQGDVLAARDALERALLIAPDFALARRLLMKITSG